MTEVDVLNYFKNTLDRECPTLSHNILIYHILNLSLADPSQSFRAMKQKRETQLEWERLALNLVCNHRVTLMRSMDIYAATDINKFHLML